MSTQDFDVVIVGGGIVGLSFALELANSAFSVAIVERRQNPPISEHVDNRVSAINRFALQSFARSGIMQSALAARACAFEKMFVWDSSGVGQIEFDSAELGLPMLGIIIENQVLQQMLLDAVKTADNITYLCPQEIVDIRYAATGSGLDKTRPGTTVSLASAEQITARLLVGADGAGSLVRQSADIQRQQQSYRQHALVCNVQTSEPHQHTAWQCFMPSGPLAFLPLFNAFSSIVWSLDEAAAAEMMAQTDDEFKKTLAQASEFRLGEVLGVGQRALFPLSHGHVTQYVKPGLALIGDAAHNIHPLAGQGANLGIADAAALAEVITTARKAGRQWWALHSLMKYQRQRKGANQLMESSMTGFKQLFGNDNMLLTEVRNAGLSLLDQLPALKYRIIRQALG